MTNEHFWMIRSVAVYTDITGIIKTIISNISIKNIPLNDRLSCYRWCKYCANEYINRIEKCISDDEKIIKDLLE